MTDTQTCPPVLIETRPPFGRGLLTTIFSYLKWGYGGLLLSFVAYGIYRTFKRLASGAHLLSEIVTAIVLLVAAIYMIRFLRFLMSGPPPFGMSDTPPKDTERKTGSKDYTSYPSMGSQYGSGWSAARHDRQKSNAKPESRWSNRLK